MTSFIITKNLLSSYYEEHFKEDLDRYSLSEYKYKLDVGVGYNLLKSPYRRSNEEEVLFVALVGFIFAAEEELLLHCPNDKDELKSLMNEFGLPWIPAVDRGRDICNFIFEPNIATKDEAVALRDAMLLVEPFMMDKLLSFIRTWDEGNFYKRNNIGFIGAYIGENLSDALVKTYRKYYDFKGLIGLDISRSKIMNYYEKDFLNHFKRYFPQALQKDGYCKTLFVDYISNLRYEDGNPGNNSSENLIFPESYCTFISLNKVF